MVLKQCQIYSKEICHDYIGIDVAKTNTIVLSQTQKEVLFNAFAIPNNADGSDLFQKISSLTNDFSNVKVGLASPDTTITIC